MTYKDFASLIRLSTSTNTATFTDVNIKLVANTFMDEMSMSVIEEVGEDWFGYPAFTSLVADRRTYELPEKLVKIKYVEAKLDGVSWEKLEEFDLNYYDHATDEADILLQWQGKKPMFDEFGGGLWLYSGDSIINVTNGLKLWFITLPASITDLTSEADMSNDPTTTTAGFPIGLHELLARRVSIFFKENKDKPIPLTEKEKNWYNDFENMKKQMKGLNLDKEIVATVPYNDGSNY